MIPTLEQNEILNEIENGYNVIVDSVAGSGKSSTILFIANKFSNQEILTITYNKRLKFETRSRAEKLCLENLEVQSFHSFGYQYFNKNCNTDYGLLESLQKEPINPFKKWSIIIFDEFQDCTPLFYEFALKIIKTIDNKDLRIIIIGDQKQSIYSYNRASPNYIEYADKLFPGSFKKKHLSQTFRLPDRIVYFINDLILKKQLLRSEKKSSIKPRYLICDQFSNDPFNELQHYLRKGYKYEDIFILAPSTKNMKSAIQVLANKCSSRGIPIHCSTGDNEALDSEIILNKIVFCSYHQCKGLERKVTIVLNFDESYIKFYNKTAGSEISNELYVAITRSSMELTVIHHFKNNYLPFIEPNTLRSFCEILVKKPLKISGENNNVRQEQIVAVTDLIKFLPIDVIKEAMSFINITQIQEKSVFINIPIKVKQDFNGRIIHENVSELNGIAIPAYYEKMTTNTMTIEEHLKAAKKPTKTKKTLTLIIHEEPEDDVTIDVMFRGDDSVVSRKFEKVLIKKIKPKPKVQEQSGVSDTVRSKMEEIAKLLQTANEYSSLKNGYKFKLDQISNYNWLSIENLELCTERLTKLLSGPGSGSISFEENYNKIHGDIMLVGYIDCMKRNQDSTQQVIEFKCVNEVDSIHFIQLALYSYLIDIPETEYILFNILDDSSYKITCNEPKKLVSFLMEHKNKKNIVNENFLEENLKIRERYPL
jgi:hypothetical protein